MYKLYNKSAKRGASDSVAFDCAANDFACLNLLSSCTCRTIKQPICQPKQVKRLLIALMPDRTISVPASKQHSGLLSHE